MQVGIAFGGTGSHTSVNHRAISKYSRVWNDTVPYVVGCRGPVGGFRRKGAGDGDDRFRRAATCVRPRISGPSMT